MSYIHILASNLFAKKTAVPLLASYGFFLHDCRQTCPFLLQYNKYLPRKQQSLFSLLMDFSYMIVDKHVPF